MYSPISFSDARLFDIVTGNRGGRITRLPPRDPLKCRFRAFIHRLTLTVRGDGNSWIVPIGNEELRSMIVSKPFPKISFDVP